MKNLIKHFNNNPAAWVILVLGLALTFIGFGTPVPNMNILGWLGIAMVFFITVGSYTTMND